MNQSPPPCFTYFDMPGRIHLALNSNKKRKTVAVKFSFVEDLSEETVTKTALVPMILRRGTRTHPTMQSISRHLEGLYGTSLATSTYKQGEWQVTQFRLEFVNERFLPGESRVFRDALTFLREMLSEPLEVEGGFHDNFLSQEKANLARVIESLVDSKGAYAEQRLIEHMCADEPYRLYEYGRLEDIDAIDAVGLREFQRAFFAGSPSYVYVVGDFDLDQTRRLMESVVSEQGLLRAGEQRLSLPPEPRLVSQPKEVRETMDVEQAKMSLGYRHDIGLSDPLYEALLVMNGILGGFSHSKLFQNVREKASLCYTVRSGIDRTKRLLFVSCGIAPEKYDAALKITREQVDALQNGEISDEEIDSTISSILNQNEMLEDQPVALAQVDFSRQLHGLSLDLSEFRERLRGVTRDQICTAAQRLQLDTTYLLTTPE